MNTHATLIKEFLLSLFKAKMSSICYLKIPPSSPVSPPSINRDTGLEIRFGKKEEQKRGGDRLAKGFLCFQHLGQLRGGKRKCFLPFPTLETENPFLSTGFLTSNP